MEEPRRALSDPDYAAFAWARFRNILKWMGAAAAAAAIVAVLALWWSLGEFYWGASLAALFGTFFTVMLTAGLMGLMFLSSGSGHDDQVEDPLKGEVEID